jgi:hypothetical protein
MPTAEETRDAIIAANIAAVESHFHNENPEDIDIAIAGYNDDIVWEVPARGLVFRDKQRVKQEYLKIFDSMKVHKITNLYRFATEQWVTDDSIFDFQVVGDGFTNCPFPVGTEVSVRIVHIFGCRDGKISRENANEIWRRAGSVEVKDDVSAAFAVETFDD